MRVSKQVRRGLHASLCCASQRVRGAGVPEGKLPKGEEIQLLRTLILSVVDDPDAPQGIQQALLTKPKRLAQPKQ